MAMRMENNLKSRIKKKKVESAELGDELVVEKWKKGGHPYF